MKKIILILSSFIALNSSAQSLKAGLMVYLPFNKDLKDYSGNDNHGIDHGKVTFTTDAFGKPNAAAYFDGVDDWVEILDSNDLILNKKATISFKFKTESENRQNIITKAFYKDASGIQFQIEFNSRAYHPTNNLLFGTEHNFSCSAVDMASHYIYADSLTEKSRWYCVAVTFDSGVKSMYIDGRLAAKSTLSGFLNNYSIDNCQSDIRVGMWWKGDPAFFNGAVDEVRIYNRVLTSQELSLLCSYKDPEPQAINEHLPEILFDLYPNPANDKIEVKTSSNMNDGYLRMYNQLGQLVYSAALREEKNSHDISRLAAGSYIVELKSNDGIGRKHFIKQ